MESCISGSTSSSRPIHVYLSFKGDDQTCKFTDMLWAALETHDLNTFWDDKKLDQGESISLPRHFLKAIRQSNISIVVFSKNYAFSIWCLDELLEIAARIHDCRFTVFPIFYDLDPSEVQNQSNSFEKAFTEHEQKFPENLRKFRSWRLAMKQVANLSGWDVPYDPCPQVIDDIVREVKKKVRELGYIDADLVGMQSRVKEVEKLLDLGSNSEVRVVGICGMGGIGKSTIARVLYDKISHHFDASHFLLNTSELHMVHGENILLIFDDVVTHQVLQPLIQAIKASLLGRGSRIVITTRDEGVLHEFQMHNIYRVELLRRDEALQLFCRKAFKCDFPLTGYDDEVINRALEYASGLPLAIVKLGSFLYNKSASEWSTSLVEFKKVASCVVMKVLKRSFYELDLLAQERFLDIACFFIGKDSELVEGILDNAYASSNHDEGRQAMYDMQRLIEKSLMAIIDRKIQMHGLLQEMGRQIVRHQSPSKPEEWSRLWDINDIYNVMQSDRAIPKVKAIVLELEDSQGSALSVDRLSSMYFLRLLIFRNVKFYGVLECLSPLLRYISWHQYPFTSLPSSFTPFFLKELILTDSCITSIWDEKEHPSGLTLSPSDLRNMIDKAAFPSLRNLNLSGSKHLMKMPNFEQCPILERLDLQECVKLSHLHPSIVSLSSLKFMNLRKCTGLVSIPNDLFSLPSLEMLNLASCSKFAYCLKFRPSDVLGDERDSSIQQSFASCKRRKLSRHKSI